MTHIYEQTKNLSLRPEVNVGYILTLTKMDSRIPSDSVGVNVLFLYVILLLYIISCMFEVFFGKKVFSFVEKRRRNRVKNEILEVS